MSKVSTYLPRPPVKALFVSYSMMSLDPERPSFIGVLKRCLRLITNIPHDFVEIHMLNLGPLPQEDQLLKSLRNRIQFHNAEFSCDKNSFQKLIASVAPEVIVLGEGPGEGAALELSLAACKLGIPQVCIENYYGPDTEIRFKKERPWLRKWLLLGLPIHKDFGPISDYAVLTPPLLTPFNEPGETKQDITILGYDVNVADLGVELLTKLPIDISAHIIFSSVIKSKIPDYRKKLGGRKISFGPLPSEAQLKTLLKASKIVICKSGFQQMVECLALQTPFVAFDAPGGVSEIFMDYVGIRKYAGYFPKNDGNWSSLLLRVACWLMEKPHMPWKADVERIIDPPAHAAQLLVEMIYDVRGTKSDTTA
ncbi:MAG: hypothetical protein JRE64_02520 [Deltaproteobacteria bacterium]|nr:hypothetical protein [Deltaproteobacteria bacterium]